MADVADSIELTPHSPDTPCAPAADTTEAGHDNATASADHDADDHTVDDPPDDPQSSTVRASHRLRRALGVGVAIALALGSLGGWLGYRTYQARQTQQQNNVFLKVGRQGALNLTTIAYTSVDADIKRILDSSTGSFYDDFQQRSQPFIDLVKKLQSKSEGTINEAGLASLQHDSAQVLVAVAVKTSNAGSADPEQRGWRMRLTVQKVGDTVKVSNVEFVP